MVTRRTLLPAIVAALLGAGSASAHHSFAAFFDEKKIVTITGAVTEFRFVNPHGTITLNAREGVGPVQVWRVETNAPVILQRRGWNRDSLKIGETVTIEGWGSRDGTLYLRLRKATRADGTVIGIPFGQES